MIYGLRLISDNELFIETDIQNFVEIEDGVANLTLPKAGRLQKIGDSFLKLLHTTFNPQLVYNGNVSGTLKGWNYLESKKIGLGRAANLLAKEEIYEILTGFHSATSSLIYPAELSFLVSFLKREGAKTLQYKIPKIRRKIGNSQRGTVQSVDVKLRKGKSPVVAVKPLKSTFTSFLSEFWICKELVEQNFDVRFNIHAKGPDLYINGKSVELEDLSTR